jgi:hypothetical protein
MSEATTAAADTTNAAETVEQTTQSAADTLYPETKTEQVDAKATETPAEKVEAKTTETEATEKAESAEKAPDKYEFEVDEDSLITDAHLDQIAKYAKEHKLSQEAAQKVVDLQAETLKTQRQSLQDEYKRTTETWLGAAKADKEIGGDAFNRNVEISRRVVDRFASPEFKKALNETGFGNHPELLRTFVRIGQAMAEDTLVVQGATSSKTRSMEDVFYGSKN